MRKTELVNNVAAAANLTKADAARAVNSVFDQISSSLADNQPVIVNGFGTFSTAERAGRTGRNPQTGDKITIPASTAVRFKASKALKEAVN